MNRCRRRISLMVIGAAFAFGAGLAGAGGGMHVLAAPPAGHSGSTSGPSASSAHGGESWSNVGGESWSTTGGESWSSTG